MTRAADPLPPMEHAPGATLPVPGPTFQPPAAPHELPPQDAIRDALDDAVAHAIATLGARDYFLSMARSKPDLFHKYVQLVLATNATPGAAGKTRTYQVVSPLAPSALDDHPAP